MNTDQQPSTQIAACCDIFPLSPTQSFFLTSPPPLSYFSMLKTQKANLVPESEFHNREERVKAQQSEGEAKPTSTSKSETVASNGIAGPAEEKPAKVPKGKAKEEKTPKGKSDEVKVRARETAGPEPAAKEKRHKEESPSLPKAKQEAAVPEKPSVRTPREKTASAGGGKGSVTKDGVATVATVTVAGSPGQRELPPTAKVGLKSPLGLNGPTTASPGRTGQRRQHSGTVSPVDGASEKGLCCHGDGWHVGKGARLLISRSSYFQKLRGASWRMEHRR